MIKIYDAYLPPESKKITIEYPKNLWGRFLKWLNTTSNVQVKQEYLGSYSRVEIDDDNLLDSIRLECLNLRIHNMEPELIIVGSNYINSLRDEIIRRNLVFDFGVDLDKMSLYGLRVRIIPSFEGILVVPKGR